MTQEGLELTVSQVYALFDAMKYSVHANIVDMSLLNSYREAGWTVIAWAKDTHIAWARDPQNERIFLLTQDTRKSWRKP